VLVASRYGGCMRTPRFQSLIVGAAAGIPGVASAKTLAEVGHTRHPFGVAVEANGKTTLWQVACQGAPDDRWSEPEPEPTLGEKLPTPEAGPLGNELSSVERALVAAVIAADPGEIAKVEVYSGMVPPPAVGHGATFTFYDGSKVFLNAAR